jgi:hypothetical protein
VTPSIPSSKRQATAFNALPGAWEKLGDEALLRLRIRDLGLGIESSSLKTRVEKLYQELELKGLKFKPPCYLADEWLCPDRVPIIGIPFFLAHPRLIALEKRMMLEAEGSTEAWCLKLLRHEAGHAFNYAYRLYSRRRWRELFGAFDKPYYSVTYDAKPYSKRFVVHLEDNYAQAHPDEDFAETFAVWLTPGLDWKAKYAGWAAKEKLEYLDSVLAEVGERSPLVKTTSTPWAADRMTSTLQAFYARKKRYLGQEFPGYYDAGLLRAFAPSGEGSPAEKALPFLRRHRKPLIDGISQFVPQRKFDVDKLFEKLLLRTQSLDLRLKHSPETTLMQVTALMTSVLASLHRFNGVHGGK